MQSFTNSLVCLLCQKGGGRGRNMLARRAWCVVRWGCLVGCGPVLSREEGEFTNTWV